MNNTDRKDMDMTLEQGLTAFTSSLLGKNRSRATVRAYDTDIRQFLEFLHETNLTLRQPGDVTRLDILEYLSDLSKKGLI